MEVTIHLCLKMVGSHLRYNALSDDIICRKQTISFTPQSESATGEINRWVCVCVGPK